MASLSELEIGLTNADKAGDAEAARAFAAEIIRLRGEEQAASPESPSMADQVKRGGALAGRALLKGVYDTVSLPINALDAATGLVDKTGLLPERLPKVNAAGVTDKVLNTFFPQPASTGERIASDVGSSMMGTGGIMSLGGKLSKAANPIVAGAGEGLAANPGLQLASTATGATAGSVTREVGGGPMAQFLATLGGSVVPFGAAKVGGKVLEKARFGDFATPEQKALTTKAEEMGFKVLAGEKLNNARLKGAESALENAPGGGAIQKIRQDNVRTLNNKALSIIGETGDAVTPDALSKASVRIGGQFDELVGNNSVTLDKDFFAKMETIRAKYVDVWNKNDQISKVIDKALEKSPRNFDHMTGRYDVDAALPGDQYQRIRSSLQKESIDKIKAGDSNTGRALGSIVEALDDAAGKSISPQALDAWQTARQQYRDLLVLMQATTGTVKGKSGVGDLDPGQLINAVVQNRGRKPFAKTPLGAGDEMADLARVSISLPDLVKNSTTAERNYWLTLMSGGAGATTGATVGGFLAGPPGATVGAGIGHAAGIAVPYAASKTMISEPVQQWLVEGFLPDLQKAAASTGVPTAALIESILPLLQQSQSSAQAPNETPVPQPSPEFIRSLQQ